MKFLLVAAISLALSGCGISGPIVKASDSRSEFGDDPLRTVKAIPGTPDLYRVYDRAASGFVPISAVREGLEARLDKFCGDQGRKPVVVASDQSNPPYILGNFPRMELIFYCGNLPAQSGISGVGDKYASIAKLKSLLDSGAITPSEFDAEKKKILSAP